jgi:transposase
MKKTDSRSLSDDALNERRRQVVRCRLNGMGLKGSAEQCSMGRTAANDAWQQYLKHGWDAVDVKRSGRPLGVGHLLTKAQQKETQRLISDKMPDQIKLPFALWTRKAVSLLIRERYGVVLAERTMSEYMKRWGFTAQKPMHRAFEQRPAEVLKWKEQTYPAIARRAKREGAEILWGDETGVRNDDVRGMSFAKRGTTPIVRVNNKRYGRSIISAISNRGTIRWMVFKGALNVRLFHRFLKRLIMRAKGKIFLILDNLPVHHAKILKPWLEKHIDRIELFFLPSYSPELNPVEVANADLKKNVTSKPPARNEEQMVESIIGHYRSIQNRPGKVLRFFLHPDVCYAA